MNHIKSILYIFLVSFFVLTIMSINFAMPTNTHAHPAYGFTPPAPPPPPDNGGDDNSNDTDGESKTGGSDDNLPTDYVLVQLDRCDLQCSADYADNSNGDISNLMASVGGGYPLVQNSALADSATSDVEVLAPVKLIHQGSNFIVEGILSDAASTRFSVPYPGQWEVFLVKAPEFASTELMDLTGLNVAQLHADLADAPISLGLVEANSPAPQLVKCPIACVIAVAPAPEEEPPYLPETGATMSMADYSFLYTSAVMLIIGGLLLILARRFFHPRQPQLVPVQNPKDRTPLR